MARTGRLATGFRLQFDGETTRIATMPLSQLLYVRPQCERRDTLQASTNCWLSCICGWSREPISQCSRGPASPRVRSCRAAHRIASASNNTLTAFHLKVVAWMLRQLPKEAPSARFLQEIKVAHEKPVTSVNQAALSHPSYRPTAAVQRCTAGVTWRTCTVTWYGIVVESKITH
jgi:hypothetical protein